MVDRYYREPTRSIVPDLLAGLIALLVTCYIGGVALKIVNHTAVLGHVLPVLRQVGRWLAVVTALLTGV